MIRIFRMLSGGLFCAAAVIACAALFSGSSVRSVFEGWSQGHCHDRICRPSSAEKCLLTRYPPGTVALSPSKAACYMLGA
jgi:hypothetical protein